MKSIITFFILLTCCLSTQAQLIINEFSQGATGTQEYIELVVVGQKSCSGDSCADIRGWIIDDNNGWYGAAANQGIAPGHIRFGDDPNWSCVPYGSIILIYNNGDKNPAITLPNDPYDANNDHVYVLPSTHNSMEGTILTPLSPSSTTYVYPTTTTYVTSPSWAALGLANTGDAVIIVDPTAPGVAYHSIAYGNLALGANATIYKATSGAAKNYYLTNDQYTSAAAYNVGNAPADETPGTPNGPANATWINSMLTTVVGSADYDQYACTLSGNPYNFNGNLLTTSGVYVDTFSTSLGCDSIIHLHLSVITPSNISETIHSCQPVVFNGITYTTSSVVNDTLHTSLGCDSAYLNVDIQIQTVVTSQLWDTISGCQTIVYKGVPYITSQEITDTIKTTYGCDSIYKMVYLNVLPTPEINMPNDAIICKGASITLTASASWPVTWQGYPQNGSSITVTPDATTTYIAHTTNELNCVGSASVVVSVEDFILSLSASTLEAEINSPVVFNTSSEQSFSITSWTPANLFADQHAIQQSITFPTKETVNIIVSGESANNCKDTASVTINVLAAPEVFIPNAFTPNGDGLNDYFKPQFIRDHTLRDFSIFNRWGQKVYGISYIQQLGNGWDGTYKGKPCDKGTYYYIISLQDPLGKETVLKGDLTLVN